MPDFYQRVTSLGRIIIERLLKSRAFQVRYMYWYLAVFRRIAEQEAFIVTNIFKYLPFIYAAIVTVVPLINYKWAPHRHIHIISRFNLD